MLGQLDVDVRKLRRCQRQIRKHVEQIVRQCAEHQRQRRDVAEAQAALASDRLEVNERQSLLDQREVLLHDRATAVEKASRTLAVGQQMLESS